MSYLTSSCIKIIRKKYKLFDSGDFMGNSIIRSNLCVSKSHRWMNLDLPPAANSLPSLEMGKKNLKKL